jgi:hypothetical protein
LVDGGAGLAGARIEARVGAPRADGHVGGQDEQLGQELYGAVGGDPPDRRQAIEGRLELGVPGEVIGGMNAPFGLT